MSLDFTKKRKSIQGMFWLPGSEENRFSGVLHLKPGKSAQLDTASFNYEGLANCFPNQPKVQNEENQRLTGKEPYGLMHIPSREIIHGHDEHGKAITLLKCFASS